MLHADYFTFETGFQLPSAISDSGYLIKKSLTNTLKKAGYIRKIPCTNSKLE